MFEIDFFSLSQSAIIQMAWQRLATDLADWEREIWNFVTNWFDTEIKSVSVFTSGSTGTPKEILHTKDAMLSSARATCNALNLRAGNRVVLCLPVNKISGMMMVVRCIDCKMKMVCIKPSTKPLSELAEDLKIDFAAFTPMQFYEITENYAVFKKADRIDKIILGGEHVNSYLLQYIQRLASSVYITFGMTETISHVALKKLNGPTPDLHFKSLPGITLETDSRGCLVIKAPQLNRPYLITNDLVELTNNNEFSWLGRFDNVINSGGIKIYPEELEKRLAELMDVPFFIGSIPDAISGEKVVLVLERTELHLSEQQLLKNKLEVLERHQRPKDVLLTSKLSRTANGKIKRKESLQNVNETIPLI